MTLTIIAIADESERGAHLRKTFSAMPQQHQDCLEFLMFHLTRVTKREPENLVGSAVPISSLELRH